MWCYHFKDLENHIIKNFNAEWDSIVGSLPTHIYYQLLEVAEKHNIFEVGYHPDGFWFAIMDDKLIWSSASINYYSKPEDIDEGNRNRSVINKFNRYTALINKNSSKSS